MINKKITAFIKLNKYTLLFVAIAFVYLLNMFIDVMEIDAAQYALISMEMSWTKSFLHIYQQGRDYLDKPPLLFWLSSLSFIVFGLANFTYKLPSVLIAILGIYSVYRFSKTWYGKDKARLAALILASSQALFLITNDVRTDTNLLGLSMFSLWQIGEYLQNSKLKHLLLASLGIGGAMLAKGPIALIIPIAAFGTHLLLKRDWKNIFKPQWIVLLVFVAIILLPMSYGLYAQFDLHPEKTVYGLEGPSGLRFFYWTQSFGRITGENYWDNDAGFFYFFHTILWDFQPWILLFIPALILKVRNLFRQRFKGQDKEEYISLGGFILVFIALSLSKYKLPHYIFVLFPLAAILTADFLYELKGLLRAGIAKSQFGTMHLFWLLMIIDFIFFFPPRSAILPVILSILFFCNWLIFYKLKGTIQQVYIPTIITAISFNLLMSTNFYPNLLSYQATSQAGKFISENKISENQFFHYNNSSYSLDFYAQRLTKGLELDEMKQLRKDCLIYTNQQGLENLKLSGVKFRIAKVFPSYTVTALNLLFLNKTTRPGTLKNEYLIEIQ